MKAKEVTVVHQEVWDALTEWVKFKGLDLYEFGEDEEGTEHYGITLGKT